jgi:hypothetical protein
MRRGAPIVFAGTREDEVCPGDRKEGDMKLLSYLFFWATLFGMVLCIVVRLFFPHGIYGIGLGSFYSFSFLSALLVICASLIRSASRE